MPHPGTKKSVFGFALALALALAVCGCGNGSTSPGQEQNQASTLFDLSGLAWIGNGTFVAVHDSKNPDELDRPRVSLLTEAQGPDGLFWREVFLDWPEPIGPSNDLESVSSIPGTNEFLLAESGDDQSNLDYQRLFRVSWDGTSLTLVDHGRWPETIYNVEAHAVAAFGAGFVFAYGERAQDEPFTRIRWARFQPDGMAFGSFASVVLDNPDLAANRPLVGMDFDTAGNLYTVAALDPNVDGGPFTSAVFRVGSLESRDGEPAIVLFDQPELIATSDGFKIESVTIAGNGTVYIGTDDEDLGNVLRPLPPAPQAGG